MKSSKNKRFVAIEKDNSARRKQSQKVNDFVIYFKMFENDLNEFIAVSKKMIFYII